jgi:hypothetical protein
MRASPHVSQSFSATSLIMSTFWIDKINIEGSVRFHKGSRASDQHGNLARTTPTGQVSNSGGRSADVEQILLPSRPG